MAAMDYQHQHQTSPRSRLPSHRTYSATSSSTGPLSTGTSRPKSQLCRDSTYDPKETTHIASDFLRSALERERASRRTTIDHSDRMAPQDRLAYNDRVVQSSPISRAATADPSRRRHQRPGSIGGGEQHHHSPMGAKEASETISRLHNENFNLKLEVYHRREREVALDERINKLEAEVKEQGQIEESLRVDLVNRDTEIKTQTCAVQEAVNVIMDLEAKLERFRQGTTTDEDDGVALPKTPTAVVRAPSRGPSRLEDEIATLARMPSFVSDLSANTENLRNVYLSNQGSALNLARGYTSDARAFTPSLSILDEIYGDARAPNFEAPPAPVREQTPVRDTPGRKTKEEKRQAIEKALGDIPHAHRQARQEKRESLRPVLTGMPMDREISREMLPPTPDTMTSSTFERGRGSKDTLSQQPSIPEDPANERGAFMVSLSNPSAAPSVTAFNDRKGLDPIPRPRSASEATTAPRWDMSDTDSMESDVDIWMRERGRASPDLFSFPPTTGTQWDPDPMFGISSATNTLSSGPAPPPPNRRSSLQARTSTPGRPRTRGTPSIVRSERFSDFFPDRDGATPPPIQLKRAQPEGLQPPDDGGVALNGPHNWTPPATGVPQPVPTNGVPTQTQFAAAPSHSATTPNTPTGPATPTITSHRRRWFGLGRVGSLRKG